SIPSAAAPAPTSAAKPEADDASPAPVGKLLRLTTLARVATPARCRSRSRQADTRASCSGRAAPSSVSSSASSRSSKRTRVSDQSPSSVIEIEPTAGILSAVSALPQYLISAMFARALALPCIRFLQVAVPLEPVDRVRDRVGRIAPSITELALGLAAREIHVLRRHSDAVHADPGLALRQLRNGFRACCDRIHAPARQTHFRRLTAAILRDELQNLLQAHVLAAEDIALPGRAVLEREKMPARDIVDVNEVQPRIDERG